MLNGKRLAVYSVRYGGTIVRDSGLSINRGLQESGWRPLSSDDLVNLLQREPRFLHRQEGFLLATDAETVRIVDPDKKCSDVWVPCVKSSNRGLALCYLKIPMGLISGEHHPDVKVLSAKS